MLEDPRINFAISIRGGKTGVDHSGFQTDSEDELPELKQRAQAADMTLLDEGTVSCCFARSEKHWVTDPQGIAWEHFHTLGRHSRVQREGVGGSRIGLLCRGHAVEPAGRRSRQAGVLAAEAGVAETPTTSSSSAPGNRPARSSPRP